MEKKMDRVGPLAQKVGSKMVKPTTIVIIRYDMYLSVAF